MAATQTTNNNSIRSILEKEKLNGSNFLDWYRNLRIVLRNEQKLHHLEEAFPEAPPATATIVVCNAYTRKVAEQQEVACLMLVSMTPRDSKELGGPHRITYVLKMKAYLDQMERLGYPMPLVLEVNLILTLLSKDYDQFVQNYNMHCMGKTIPELPAMLKLAEKGIPKKTPAVLTIRQELKKNKSSTSGTSGIFTIELFSFPKSNTWIYDTGCGTHICNTIQGLRGYRKLNKGALDLNKKTKHNLDSTFLWHCRLGHINKKHIAKLQHDGLLASIDDESFDVCVSCISGKMARKPFTFASERVDDLLGIIHSDVCRPFRTTSKEGANYYVTFTDDFSRYGYVYLIKHKHEVFEILTTLPMSFWGYALESVARLLNMVPTKKGCEALVKRDTPNKLESRSIKCIFVGYPKETMGYYFYYPLENKFFVARYAEFFKTNLIKQEASGSTVDFDKIQREDAQPSENTSQHQHEVEHDTVEPQTDVTPVRRSVRIPQAPKQYGFYIDVEEHKLGDHEEPPNYRAALSYPEFEKWLEAMNAKMQSMKDNQVWNLVDLPPNCKTVGSKWLFKKKTDMDGNIHTYKAHLVEKGFTQTYGVDYEETFSPVADIKAIRILIAIVAYYDYEIWKMDVKTTFLNGRLNEDVYMVQPEGFENPKHPRGVCKLQISIYRLKQASRSWNKRFDEEIKSAVDWKSSKQSTTAMSFMKAEYIAAAEAAMEAIWIRKFISGLGVIPSIDKPMDMYCENTGAITMADELGVQKDNNLADSFTKPMPCTKHVEHARSIGLRPVGSFITISTTSAQQVALDNALVPLEKRVCLKLPHQEFDALPSDEEIVSFIKELGHKGDVKSITKVVVDHMYQPWRTFAAIINKCLSGKITEEEEPKPAKKVISSKKPSTKRQSAGVRTRDTPGVSVSKKKTPSKAKRSKGIDLLSEAALLEEAQVKKVLRRSHHETLIHQAGGSGDGIGSIPGVLDESKGKSGDSGDEANEQGDEEDVLESDDDQEEADDERTESDNPRISDEEEETQDDECVHTPKDYVPTNDESKNVDEEEYERINEELYGDVNISLTDVEPADKEKDDEEMTVVGHVNVNQEGAGNQVKDDAHATQKIEVPIPSSSIASDYAAKYLNFDNIPLIETEVVSMLDINVQYEVLRTSPLLTIPVFVILEHTAVNPPEIVTIALSTTISSLLNSLFPHLQQLTPIPTPTTKEATTSTTDVPDSETLTALHQRITDLEKEVKELKIVDHSAALLSTIKSEVPNAAKE
ncbi:retrotransposon protein, putative, ty1-copia subclass [Tanacetum coccineum]